MIHLNGEISDIVTYFKLDAGKSKKINPNSKIGR
jgi:hypothetical protein